MGSTLEKEIEKKFKLYGWSPIGEDVEEMVLIQQHYLFITPQDEERIRVYVDIRGKPIKYEKCYKRGKGEVRDEIDYVISKEAGEKTWSRINKLGLKPITKRRYWIKYKGKMIEVDDFYNYDLQVAEIEFDSEEEMENFDYPDWFGEEISITNAEMWKKINEERI